MEFLSAPIWTRKALQAAKVALDDLSLDFCQEPDLQIRHLETVNPHAAQLVSAVSQGWTRDQKIAFWSLMMAFLSTVLGSMKAFTEDEPLTPQEIAVIVEEAVKQSQADTNAEPPATEPFPLQGGGHSDGVHGPDGN